MQKQYLLSLKPWTFKSAAMFDFSIVPRTHASNLCHVKHPRHARRNSRKNAREILISCNAKLSFVIVILGHNSREQNLQTYEKSLLFLILLGLEGATISYFFKLMSQRHFPVSCYLALNFNVSCYVLLSTTVCLDCA